MNERPKRERKPTQPFQYHDTSAESIIANAGSTSPQRRSRNKSRDNAKTTRGTSKGRGGSRGRSRGRGTGRGRGRGRGQNNNGGIVNSRRRSPMLDTDEQTDNDFSALFSDLVGDTGALVNDTDDSDYEKDDLAITDSPVSRSKNTQAVSDGRKILVKSVLARHRCEDDEVIEQWYADPYERINPNDAAYDQWRFRNLLCSLQNRGYSIVNSKQMAAWLMKCNGQFSEFTAPVRKSRAKKPTQAVKNTPQHQSVTPRKDMNRGNGDEIYDVEDHETNTQNQRSGLSAADDAFAAFQAAMLPRTGKSNCLMQPSEKESNEQAMSAKSARPSETSFEDAGFGLSTSTQEQDKNREQSEEQDEDEVPKEALHKKSRELSDKLKLENLKRCLNVFHAVYGPQELQEHPTKFEHNYFSNTSTLPVLIPKAGLRTQAHYALQEILVPADDPAFSNGPDRRGSRDEHQAIDDQETSAKLQEVFTEDPDFGLTVFPPSRRATEADMKLYYAQFERAKTVNQSKPNATNEDEPDARDEANNEEILDKTVRRALIKIRNEESAKIVSEQLQQTFFDWETPSTMEGRVPRLSKDDPMRDGNFALKERHVWQEIRKRQAILDSGGEEAARLLEQEWEDAQLEARREERRQANARLKAKKRAAQEANMARFEGMGKRVKFTEWTGEEWY